jgi:hypothetical protein
MIVLYSDYGTVGHLVAEHIFSCLCRVPAGKMTCFLEVNKKVFTGGADGEMVAEGRGCLGNLCSGGAFLRLYRRTDL